MKSTDFIEQIEEKACYWITRIDSGEITKRELGELKKWIKSDIRHQRTFEHFAESLLSTKDILDTVGEAVRDLEGKTRQTSMLGLFQNTLFAGRASQMAVVAVCCVLFTVTFFSKGTLFPDSLFERNSQLSYISNVGETRIIHLPDGSLVTLNTNTQILVSYSKRERNIVLERGEAIFSVAKDKARPFRVQTRDALVQALGTIFSIKTDDDSIEVLVEEGVVNVVPQKQQGNSTRNEPKEVSAGRYTKLTLNSGGEMSVIEDAHLIQRRLSWRAGMLNFDNEPLVDIVRELNRYSNTKIVIVDSDLSSLKLGGVFPIKETEAFLGAIEQGFDINIKRLPGDRIELSKKHKKI